ncbi:MAG: hypothetical protein ACD_46C00103G0007 [uncultured bacterium]|nr:MAG: hypothetical protein ACD_46C00103G0007 [uncultured bacterium]
MGNIHEIIGIIAGILALAGYIPYIISILRGKTKPNRASWFIWALVGGLLAFSYFAEGDPHAIWLPIGYFIGPFITAVLSIRYGYSEWTRLDTFCIIAALISIIPWVLSQDAILTLIINVIIDAAGAIPTLVKSYYEPETEDFTAWLIFFIANTLQLFAITIWNLSAIYPIYLFFLAGIITYFIVKDKIKQACTLPRKSQPE